MMELDNFFLRLKKTSLAPWVDLFQSHLKSHFSGNHWESLVKWRALIQSMPEVDGLTVDFASSVVTAAAPQPLAAEVIEGIEKGFKALNPWRKGPFDLCGVYIDSEWQSDMKWDRIKEVMAPLDGRVVLDVGCGNGYHCFRAVGAGADVAIGIDHKLTFFAQNQALMKYLPTEKTAVLPMGIDDMPDDCNVFDTVLSMGVLYHVHSPLDHIRKMRSLLRDGGEVILETLVIEGKAGDVLVPESRYACMPNVRNVPSCETVIDWMKTCELKNVRLVDVTPTTPQEQHVNAWGVWQSLEHFLDPEDSRRTIEGYPAPLRAIFVANQ